MNTDQREGEGVELKVQNYPTDKLVRFYYCNWTSLAMTYTNMLDIKPTSILQTDWY